jgi:phosphoribosylpyrophosphate synthetase
MGSFEVAGDVHHDRSLRRASASRITAVVPFYVYARQDRKGQPRVPITSIVRIFENKQIPEHGRSW